MPLLLPLLLLWKKIMTCIAHHMKLAHKTFIILDSFIEEEADEGEDGKSNNRREEARNVK